MRSRSRPALVALAFALAAPMALAGALLESSSSPAEFLVGFHGKIDTGLLKVAGGTVLRELPDIGVAQVSTKDPVAFVAAVLRSPSVEYAESNDRLRLAGASPDAARWDASSWDSARWDASSWDASSWDAARWDASSWDASSWDASSWDASDWYGKPWGRKPVMDPGYRSQWGLGAANFPDAWRSGAGANRVTLCILDTGVDVDHRDLAANLWTQKGVVGYNAMLKGSSPDDDVGHGSHVAGIAAAVSGNGVGVTGAVKERVQAVKVMDASGGTEADLASGLVWCAKNGARVASMSLHIDAPSESVERAVTFAAKKALFLVAAAGNSGGAVQYPAAYPGVAAVGAVGPDGKVPAFSNRGPDLDLVAPGLRIGSTFRDDGYAIGSGTSQAVPFVAAAAALVWEKNPILTPDDVLAILKKSARDFGPAGHDDTYGAGALDAGAAVSATPR